MITNSEIKDSITKINVSKVPSNVEIRYNASGQSDEKRKNKFDLEDTVAYHVKIGNKSAYRIKCDKSSGKFYNPTDGMKPNMVVGNIEKFKFLDTNENAFNYYVQFLKNNEESLLKKAERA